MKNFMSIIMISTIAISCDQISQTEESLKFRPGLTHLFVPHVAVTHDSKNPDTRYFSTLLVVEKGQQLWFKSKNGNQIDPNGEKQYDLLYAFDNPGTGWKSVTPNRKIALENTNFELWYVSYLINDYSRDSTTRFESFVQIPPKYHPEHGQEEIKLHDGTIHYPGN